MSWVIISTRHVGTMPMDSMGHLTYVLTTRGVGSLLKSGIVSLHSAISLISTSVAIVLSALSHKSDNSFITAIYYDYVIIIIIIISNTHNNNDYTQMTGLSITGRK